MNTELQPAVAGVRVFPDGRLTAQDAAAYCGISYKTLAIQRSQGNGPKFVKLGKAVFYRKDDLDDWMASCRVASTAEYKARNGKEATHGR